MNKSKIFAFICFPLCFIWMVKTIMMFWHDVELWKDPNALVSANYIWYAVLFLILRNIPTLIVLYVCSKAFDD
jgi:hypothetical protein